MGLNLRANLDPPFEDNLVHTNRLIDHLDAAESDLLETFMGGVISAVAGLERDVRALEKKARAVQGPHYAGPHRG